MTGLLASVTSAAEARIALDAGADIIDLKNPTEGALGALPLDVIRDAVRAVGRRKPVSATVGDLLPQADVLSAAVESTRGTGVDYIKIGLFETAGFDRYLRILAPFAADGAPLIAVLFADREPGFGILDRLAASGFAGVMLDTADKSSGGLCRHMDTDRLGTFVQAAREHGLLCGLAGSLRIEDIEPLLRLQPDYLGFRTALCRRGQRNAAVDPKAVETVRIRIPLLERESRVPA